MLRLLTLTRTSALWATLAIAALTAWVLQPGLATIETQIFGDAQTDALRGAWGFSHVSRSLASGELPWESTLVNFPTGAHLLVLPLASGILLSPLGVLDPVLAWNIDLFILLFGAALGTAWLGRRMTDSWLCGVFAGAFMLGQPMLHHALADGTPEHLALWSLPLFIGCAWTALHEQSPRWGLAAGLLSIVVALDSPYHAIYALVLGSLILPTALRRVKGRERDLMRALASIMASAAVGVWVIWSLYSPYETSEAEKAASAALQSTNATDLKLWWRHMGMADGLRDFTQPPTLIPNILLTFSIILSLVAGRRGAMWLVAGLVMLALSFGTRQNLPTLLDAWLGAPAGALGAGILRLNEWVYGLPITGEIRFPRRWLVPSALSLSMGASLGLDRVLSRWVRQPLLQLLMVVVVALSALHIGLRTSRVHNPFPHHSYPTVAFTETIAAAEDSGAVLLLPIKRSVQAGATRDKLPVFASLGSVLASADDLYLQMRHEQRMVSFPSLQTLAAQPIDEDVLRVLRDWSDLAVADTPGRGIPPSAFDPGVRFQRDKGFRKLRQEGLRWIAVDRAAYTEEGMTLLRDQLGNKILNEQRFSEGTGVVLLELSPAPILATEGE